MAPRPRSILRRCWLPLASRAARIYTAGPELTDGLRVCHWAGRYGMAATLGFWNLESDSPRTTADTYLAALDALAREELDCYLSIKLPALDFSPDLLADLAERAGTCGVLLHLDSLGPETTDRTFAVMAEHVALHGVVGCTLPGRWRRSLADADRVVELGLPVRVVKGQWADPDHADVDPRDGFLAVIDRLAGRARHVAVATHDAVLARAALERLRAAGTACEAEMLFGLPLRPVLRVTGEADVPVRLYVPYGHAWLPYLLSGAMRNPRTFWWAGRDVLFGVLHVPRPHLDARHGAAARRAKRDHAGGRRAVPRPHEGQAR
jgi:proline dehydrogenase